MAEKMIEVDVKEKEDPNNLINCLDGPIVIDTKGDLLKRNGSEVIYLDSANYKNGTKVICKVLDGPDA